MVAAFAWALCLMGAVVIASIVLTGAGRAKADFTLDDLKAPRAMFNRLPPFGQRAVWAQENSWEALTLGAPAMLLCLVAGVESSTAIAAAWIWPAVRVVYLFAYVGNIPPLRGLCWASGVTAVGICYVEGLRAVIAASN
ncbi:MAPEG family protein [Synechococcus sp. MIT S1220]|uniref:MAPEG family protein n=1 Tax=Synechococcus sp. MIT S1220 TaxID=3082549 RepID=UPI0039AF2FEA